ncbi:MAG TPA: flippase [Ardenticatenaceae bacterium]|nr:flippase [Ardenticatenaceae bacterium]
MGASRTIVGNALSLLTSDVMNRATTFVLYALVARNLGAFEFGQLSLALTFFYTFQVLAAAGLKTLITREVAKDRTKTGRYLANGSAVVVTASLLSIATLALLVRLLSYSPQTSSVILLLALGLLPYSLSAVCEGIFQAWERMHLIAVANVPVNVAKIALAFLILSRGYGLWQLVILLLACQVAILLIEWTLMARCIPAGAGFRLDRTFSLALVRSTSTFLGIDGIIAVMSSLNIFLLSKLAGEREVGLYSAAVQLMVPVTLVFQSVVLSVFPLMCRRFEPSLQGLKQIAERLIAMLLAVALPAVIGLVFLAAPALVLLYGEPDFALAAGALRIVSWNLLLAALTSVLGQVLVASLRERVTLRIVAANTLVGLLLGVVLISQFGLIGAAISALATKLVDFVQHYVPVSRQLAGVGLRRALWRPAIAGACMAAYLVAARDQNLVFVVVSAAALYAAVMLALVIWASGGPRQLKARYTYLWSE